MSLNVDVAKLSMGRQKPPDDDFWQDDDMNDVIIDPTYLTVQVGDFTMDDQDVLFALMILLQFAGVKGIDNIVLDREPVAVSEKGILLQEDPLGHDGGNSRDDDASVLIIVFVSLTVVLVVFGIVMLKCFTMK